MKHNIQLRDGALRDGTETLPASLTARVLARLADPRVRVALQLCVLAAAIAVILRIVDGRETLAALARADWRPLALALLLVQAQIALSALRWRLTARRLGIALPTRVAVREYYVASFLNQVLPGGVAGDAIRAVRNRETGADGEPRWRAIVRSVALERAAGQTVFFATTLLGLALAPLTLARALPDRLEIAVAVPIAIAILIVLALVAIARRGPRPVRAALANLGPDIAEAFLRRGALPVQFGLSALIVAAYLGVFALCGAALSIELPLAVWLTIAPLVLVAMLVPVSVGGWGLREGAAAALFPLVGVDAALGLAVAILYGLTSLAGALPGLVLALRARR
ncbi:YbhN family protein [Salinarimonas sp.]|uniref:lysylphosphatidylglycerol synthase transmembrane domain-containing protein n=1 Tax=Salinarimonas sp. TaxID=2766526 RepID=UPI00391BD4A3